ncbi:MAG: hypothetical protein KBH39_08100 [Chitinophagales bacterium]|nr:hypothetical protein [Chitinophagales bacterium]MBP9704651.1 hypothetical protein [Chitinophagales bacterium]
MATIIYLDKDDNSSNDLINLFKKVESKLKDAGISCRILIKPGSIPIEIDSNSMDIPTSLIFAIDCSNIPAKLPEGFMLLENFLTKAIAQQVNKSLLEYEESWSNVDCDTL